MASKDPYADSPYDAAGMPTGTTYADYDNEEERRKNQVRTRIVAPESINDIDYQPEETDAEKEFKKRRLNNDEFKLAFNSAHELPLEVQPEHDDSFLEEEEVKKDVKK